MEKQEIQIKPKGYTKRQLKLAELVDRARARRRPDLMRFGKSGRITRQLSMAAVMNAVNTEGPEVLHREADGYWRDQDRRYFGINEGAVRNAGTMRNRWGRVKFRRIYGQVIQTLEN